MTPSLGKFWTIANCLSLLRVALAVPITLLILNNGTEWWAIDITESRRWTVGLILLAALTDWFDGHIARWSSTVSNWGKALDPLCDKAAVILISVALVINGDLPWWFVGLVAVRDILIVIGSYFLTRRINEVKMSMLAGKLAVSGMALTILFAVAGMDEPVLRVFIWITVALMLYSYLLYVLRYIRLVRAAAESPHVADLPA